MYTVSSGKCPSFSCATSSSLFMLTAGPRGQFTRWRRSRKRLSVCSVLRCPNLWLQCSSTVALHGLEKTHHAWCVFSKPCWINSLIKTLCVSCWTAYILQDDTRSIQCQVNIYEIYLFVWFIKSLRKITLGSDGRAIAKCVLKHLRPTKTLCPVGRGLLNTCLIWRPTCVYSHISSFTR